MRNLPKSVVGAHPEVIEGLVRLFLRILDERCVVWAIAHGWYGLPRYARHDMDILIRRSDVKVVEAALRAACRQTGWVLYGSFRNSILWSYWLLLPGAEQSYFQLDVMTEAGMRGRPFFRTRLGRDELGRRWRNDDGIWCVSYAFAAASDLLKELIANSRFEGVLRIRHVEDALECESDALQALLSDAIGDSVLAQEIVAVCKRKAWSELARYAACIRKNFRRYTWRDIPSLTRYGYDYFRLRFRPFLRLMVVVIGPDGCGKTTVGDGIETYFRDRPFLNVMRIHSNFSSAIRMRDIKSFLFRLMGKDVCVAQEKPAGTPGLGMVRPLPMLRSMAYVAYYGFWFALGRIQLWKWRTFSSIIIADRYYYDYYYMRGHMNSPRWFKNLIEVIVPRPNLIFYLDRPAEVIFKQKPELSVSEIRRQQSAIREFLKGRREARIVDASQGIRQTIGHINSEIEHWLVVQKG